MRCVRAPASVTGPFAPDREALESVRHLGRRFPQARVRAVPILRAAELDTRADPSGATRVWLALEALQVTGSVHVRGALVALAQLARASRRHVVAPSFGNFGVAVAYAAQILDMSATVVVPLTTPRIKREKAERYGATLVAAPSDHYDAVDRLARDIASREGAALVTSDDDTSVMLGSGSSLGFEIVRGLGGVPERVIAPLETGALTTGLAWALASETGGSAERVVWGVESELAVAPSSPHDGLARRADGDSGASFRATLAEELAPLPTAAAVERACTALAGLVVVDEREIGAAMAHAFRDMGLILEGTAAMALAPLLFGLPEPVRGGDVVAVLTGRNVDPDCLEAVASSAPPIVREDRAPE
jgi:threonine dehydratase